MTKTNVAVVCKLMPLYRKGVFQELTKYNGKLKFYFLGDTKIQAGIQQISYEYSSSKSSNYIRWIKTKNYFYKPERLLWQTGIIKEIFKSKFKIFIFEGAIAHYPIWLFAALCKLRGKKVLYWTHGNRGNDKGVKKKIRKILFKWLGDGLLLYGNFQRNNMIMDGYNPENLHVIYNSLQPEKQFEILSNVNYEEISKFKSNLFSQPDDFTLIFIGRLVAQKQVMKILEIQKVLLNKNIGVNTIFIGDGPERQNLEKKAIELSLGERIHFAEAIYNEEEIATFFCMSDMMISPGNVGLNCIHSLGYGVPVLTHNNLTFQNPEVEAILEGENGCYYVYNDFEDLALKLELWIKSNVKNDKKVVISKCQDVIYKYYNPNIQARFIIQGIQKQIY